LPGARDQRHAPAGSDQVPAPDQQIQYSAGEAATHVGRPDAQAPADSARRPDVRLSDGDERRKAALEALPPGHPSSPYQADGSRRPAEPSLRSLELPLPDEWDEDDWAEDRQWSEAGERAGADNPAGEEERVGEDQPEKLDTPDNLAGHASDQQSDGAWAPDTPGPLEGRHQSYWTEVPRFERMWDDHERRWPKDQQPAATVDRSRDPPGSWRSDSNLVLGPQDHAHTKDAISGVQAAETRVTSDLEQVVRGSAFGGELVGLEFRCKGEDRLKEKVAEALQRRPDTTPEEAMRDVNDAIRYTVRFGQEVYSTGCQDVCERLTASGYEMFYGKNHWEDPEYKGINTRWTTPEGQRFEVQFHTPESYHAKQEVTHGAYERIRNPLTTRPELAELEEFQREVSSWIPVPKGATGALDYRRDGT
jgi:hypothetical protein